MSKTLLRRKFLKQIIALSSGLVSSSLIFSQNSQGETTKMNMGSTKMNHNSRMKNQMACHSNHLFDSNYLPMQQSINSLSKLENQSKKPGLFQAKITAKPTKIELIPGTQTEFWTYNDLVPGPLIEVFEGETVEIEFENKLPQPTTIHWHGISLPIHQDGGPMDLVMPGETRIYKFTLKENSAGTYWFHPHPHNMTAEQVFRGLAGAFIIKSKNDPLKNLPERHLIFSDLKLDQSGQIEKNTMMDWMNGREGQFALLNGQNKPTISLNQTERWRIWNMNSARYINLYLEGIPFTLVGTDGGLLENPQKIDKILLTPGERIEIIIDPIILAKTKNQFLLSSAAYDRGKMMGAGITPTIHLAEIQIKTNTNSSYKIPQNLRKIQPYGKEKTTRLIELTEIMEHGGMHNVDEYGHPTGMQFLLNGKKFDHARADFRTNVGNIELWEFYNNSDMDHPMHIHGTQFQIISRQMKGESAINEPFIAWKDTVNVRPNETVRVKFAQSLPGDWMFHCHILEHEDLGMMGIVRVI